LRTVRRAMLSRTIRMLHQKYEAGRKKKDSDWKKLDDFFARIDRASVGFISMNWDTVIERKLALTQDNRVFDYCCDASRAIIPDPPEEYSSKKGYLKAEDYYSSKKEYLKAKKVGQVIKIAAVPVDRKILDRTTPIVKIHGSSNWLYCDNCRQLFWFDPGQSLRIADQLIRPLADQELPLNERVACGRDYKESKFATPSKMPLLRGSGVGNADRHV